MNLIKEEIDEGQTLISATDPIILVLAGGLGVCVRSPHHKEQRHVRRPMSPWARKRLELDSAGVR